MKRPAASQSLRTARKRPGAVADEENGTTNVVRSKTLRPRSMSQDSVLAADDVVDDVLGIEPVKFNHLNLVLRTIDGQKKTIRARADLSLGDLRAEIHRILGYQPSDQVVLILGLRKLRIDLDRKALTEAGINEGTELAVMTEKVLKVVTYSKDGSAAIWNGETGECLLAMLGHRSGLDCGVSAAFEELLLTAATEKSAAAISSIATGQCLRMLRGHEDALTAAVLSGEGSYALTGSVDCTARIWHTRSGECLQTFTGHLQPVTFVAVSQDASFVLTRAQDSTVRIWSVEDGTCLRQLKASTACFAADSRRVLTSWDSTANVWHYPRWECLQSLVGHGDRINSAVFSPDDQQVLTSSSDSTARIWCVNMGVCVGTFRGHSDGCPVWSAEFSADGHLVVTASEDLTAKIWNVNSRECIQTLRGHRYGVVTAALSPDSSLVLTTSPGTAWIWSATTGRRLWILYNRDNRGNYGEFILSASFAK